MECVLFLPEGYTSISVREPLANIKAQTKVTNQRSRTQELVDPHYATVSDDSGELWTLICRGCRQIHGLSLLKNENELRNSRMRSNAWLSLTTGWTVRVLIPSGVRFSAHPDQPWGPPSLLYNGYWIFPGGKVRPGRAADHSPPSSAEVMEL